MMQAMLFAAGKGTRLKPLTDTMPKAMVEVGGKPLIRRVIEKLKAAGTDRIVVNVHHFASQITDYLQANANFNTDIRISDETARLLNTGGGIKKAAPLFDSSAPILIHNVDILSNLDLHAFYSLARGEEQACGEGQPCGDAADAVLLVSERKTQRYFLFDDDMRLVGWTNIATGEVKSPYPGLDVSCCRKLAFAGIHVFSPRLFAMMEEWPDEFSIVDFYLAACATHKIVGYAKPDLQLMDIGKLDTLAHAEEFLEKVKG